MEVPASRENELARVNGAFYEALWSAVKLVEPERFNTWPLVGLLAATSTHRLEIAPGLRPRLPIAGTQFVDISAAALKALANRGGKTTKASILSLPFDDGAFDLIAVLDIIEHVDDDDRALAEVCRVASPGAVVLIATPLHAHRWNAFDSLVGHCRRYEPAALVEKLSRHGLAIEQSAAYGMQPRSSKLLDVATWFLKHRRRKAMWFYNHLFMPIGMQIERRKKLQVRDGLIDVANVDEILLVCRKKNGKIAAQRPT